MPHGQLQRPHDRQHAILLVGADEASVAGDLSGAHREARGRRSLGCCSTIDRTNSGNVARSARSAHTSVVRAMSMVTASPCSSSSPDTRAAISICAQHPHTQCFEQPGASQELKLMHSS